MMPPIELTFTIRPLGPSSERSAPKSGPKAWMVPNIAVKLVSIWARILVERLVEHRTGDADARIVDEPVQRAALEIGAGGNGGVKDRVLVADVEDQRTDAAAEFVDQPAGVRLRPDIGEDAPVALDEQLDGRMPNSGAGACDDCGFHRFFAFRRCGAQRHAPHFVPGRTARLRQGATASDGGARADDVAAVEPVEAAEQAAGRQPGDSAQPGVAGGAERARRRW